MTQAKHIEIVRRMTAAGVSQDVCERYVALLKRFLGAKLNKIDFENELRKLLPPDKIRTHNQIIKWILVSAQNRKHGVSQLPVLIPAKDKKAGLPSRKPTTPAKAGHNKLTSIPSDKSATGAIKKALGSKRKASEKDLDFDDENNLISELAAGAGALPSDTKRKPSRSKKGAESPLLASSKDAGNHEMYIQRQVQQYKAQRKKNQANKDAALSVGEGKDGLGALSADGGLAAPPRKPSRPPSKKARTAAESKANAAANAMGLDTSAVLEGGKQPLDSMSGAQGSFRGQPAGAGRGKAMPPPGIKAPLKPPARLQDVVTYPNVPFVPSVPGIGVDFELFMRLRHRMQRVAGAEHGISNTNDDAVALVGHALELHLKNILEACALTRKQRCGDASNVPSLAAASKLDASGMYKRITPYDVLVSAKQNQELLGDEASVNLERLLYMMH